jgi:uncharacterized Zn-binding protein involved in type VI secretion
MPGLVRAGDLCSCVCPCHDSPIGTIGVFVGGAGTVTSNGIPTMRVGDMAICSCGHMTLVAAGSPTVTAEGRGVARVGDPVVGCPSGTIITGSSDVTNG